jgi:hypothetical protein
MRAFGAPVTRSFGRSTNRPVTCRAGFCFLLKQSADGVATSRERHRWQACDYSPHYGRWPSLLPLPGRRRLRISGLMNAELKYHEALAPIRPVFRTDSPPRITDAHINRFRERARFHFGVSYALLIGILILFGFAIYIFLFAQQIDRGKGSIQILQELLVAKRDQEPHMRSCPSTAGFLPLPIEAPVIPVVSAGRGSVQNGRDNLRLEDTLSFKHMSYRRQRSAAAPPAVRGKRRLPNAWRGSGQRSSFR